MSRRRIGIYDQKNRARAERLEAMTPQQRDLEKAAAKLKLLQPVKCAPVIDDPLAIDWETHDCGYVPRTGPDGKKLPKSGLNAEPAWRWTEEKSPTGRPCLRTEVRSLVLNVYRLGYRHNLVELHQEGGFPDDIYWGRHGPRIIIRELKAMRPDWKRGQKQHLTSLLEAGLDVAVWFPCCLLSGHIDEQLAALAGVPPTGTYARRRQGEPNRPLTWQDIAEGALDATT